MPPKAARPQVPRDELARKLGIRPGSRVGLSGVPQDVRTVLGPSLRACTVVELPGETVEVGLVFAATSEQLAARLRAWAPALAPAGALWLAWPKQASGVPTDLTDRAVRALGLARALVDVKVVAVSEVWSALKFVRRLRDR